MDIGYVCLIASFPPQAGFSAAGLWKEREQEGRNERKGNGQG